MFKVDLSVSPVTATTLTTLASGERVYALPTISGNSVYFISSLGSLQSAIGNSFTATGNLVRISLGSTPTVTTLATVKQGASEVAVDASGNVIGVSATGITQNGNSGADKSQATVKLQNASAKPVRVRAWLRSALSAESVRDEPGHDDHHREHREHVIDVGTCPPRSDGTPVGAVVAVGLAPGTGVAGGVGGGLCIGRARVRSCESFSGSIGMSSTSAFQLRPESSASGGNRSTDVRSLSTA